MMVYLGKCLNDKALLSLCSHISWFHLSQNVQVFILCFYCKIMKTL